MRKLKSNPVVFATKQVRVAFVPMSMSFAPISTAVFLCFTALPLYAQHSASSFEQVREAGRVGATSAPAAYSSFSQRLRSVVGELRLNVATNRLPADGVSALDVTLDVLDGDGKPLKHAVNITVEISGGARIQVAKKSAINAVATDPDADLIVPGTQLVNESGVLRFKVIAPLQPGEMILRASFEGRQVDLALSALPDERDMFAVGLIELQVRGDKLDTSKILPVRENDGLDQELRAWRREFGNGKGYVASRAAVYLKGMVSGNYLLTLSFDSEKTETKRLFQDIDPNSLYPVYGDSSSRGIDGQSSSRLFVRVDKGRSYLQYGDLSSTAGSSTLSAYSRSMTGLKGHYQEGMLEANAWVARDTLRQVVDEFPGRGVSGPYSVSNPNGVQGSEKVEILVRDRNQPSIILQSTLLARFSDYEFEPFSGRILFKSPIPSVDDRLNLISIRVTYEVDQGGQRFTVIGADAKLKLSKDIVIGVAAAKDANPISPYKVFGVSAEAKIGSKTNVKAEIARTDGLPNTGAATQVGATPSVDSAGSAVRVELTHDGDVLRGRAYAAKAQEGYNNPSAGITGGRTELGAQAAFRLSKEITLKGDARRSEDIANSQKAAGIQLGIEYKPTEKIAIEAGVRRAKQNSQSLTQAGNISCGGTLTTQAGQSGYNTGFGINSNGGQQIDPNTGLPVVCNNSALQLDGVTGTETTNNNVYIRGRYEINSKVAVFGELSRDNSSDAANAAGDSTATLYALGAEYRPYDKARVYVRHEQSRSLTGLFGLGSGDSVRMTTLGVDSEYMQDGYVFSEYRLRDALSGRDVQNAIGLRNGWVISPGLKLLTTAEILRTSPVANGAGIPTPGNLTKALGLGIEYTANPLWKASGRLEWRNDNSNTNYLMTVGVAGKINRDWTALARNYYNATLPNAGGRNAQDRLQLGFAYRPVDNNLLDVLGLFEHKTEKDTTIVSGVSRTANILSARLNYHPSAPWFVSGRVAYKQVRENLLGTPDSYKASLLGGRVMYDISNRWTVGLHLSSLQGKDARQYAYGLEAGYTVMDNFLVVLGYTWRGFNDTDLAQENYTNRGWYLGLRYKFDEDLFSGKNSNVNKTLLPGSSSSPSITGDKK